MSATPRRSCSYCSLPRARVKRGRREVELLACVAHLDLLALDPHHGLAVTLAREAYPALDLDARAPSKLRRERVR